MTIVEKWRLMMSSFADIKSAIIEKGGTIPTNKGYNRYANAIRQLYSNTYTDELEYPKRIFIAISNAINYIRWCKAIKEQIRLAIVDGGVECGTDVPLSEYGDKIRQIQVFDIVTNRVTMEYGIECSIQLEAHGGVPPYTWAYDRGIYPGGIKLNSNGVLSGTPISTGYYKAWYVSCKDSTGRTVIKKVGLLVNPRAVHVELVGPSTFTYDGEPHTLTFRCIEVPEIPITVKLGIDRLSEATEATTYYAQLYISGPYSINQEHDYYLTIEPLKVNISHSTPQTYMYDGEPHGYEYVTTPEYVPKIMYKPYSSSDNLSSPRKDSGYTDTPPSEVGKYRVWFSTADNNHTISDGSNQSPWYVFGVIEIKEADNV